MLGAGQDGKWLLIVQGSFLGDECSGISGDRCTTCEYTKNQGAIHFKTVNFFWYVNYISIRKENKNLHLSEIRVPWVYPVQCQPYKRYSKLGKISERTQMGQRLRETFSKSSQSIEKVDKSLGPVCSNSFEDLI